MSSPRILKFRGKKGDLRFWAKETGLKVGGIRNRLYNYRWPVRKVLGTPKPELMPLPPKGERHGLLVIQKSARIYWPKIGNVIYCRCNCDCGTKGVIVMYKSLKGSNDRRSKTRSCGCLRKAKAKELIKQVNTKTNE